MVSWTPLNDIMTLAGAGWQNYDAYTNLGVPKGAVLVVRMVTLLSNNQSHDLGVRTDGSSLDRYFGIHESEAGGVNGYIALVLVDASSGYIETYCDDTVDCVFTALGYFDGVSFT